MTVPKGWDFSGWVTKNDLKCSDGRTIRHGAFQDMNGQTVPLVWRHMRDDPTNVLGHVFLEHRDQGVYGYAYLNDSANATHAKKAVVHKDLTSFSIFANQLIEKAKNVMHGVIREVSLVIAGANPGAKIENLAIEHGDGSETSLDDEALIYTATDLVLPADASHEDEERTVGDVVEGMTDEQRDAMYIVVANVMGDEATHSDDDEDSIEHEEGEEMGDKTITHNVFDQYGRTVAAAPKLTREDLREILNTLPQYGKLSHAFAAHEAGAAFLQHAEESGQLEHAGTYGIGSDRTNLEILFPNARAVSNTPDFISRPMDWVERVIGGTKKSPFSRVKVIHADITADEARARGYITGNQKVEEVFPLLTRETNPQTIYKLQRLDRDDIIDITSFDVVMWLKAEMRMMIREEIARALLISDGRSAGNDKIDETKIRPIWKDADLYAIKVRPAVGVTYSGLIDDIIRSREDYRGSGQPSAYVSPGLLTEWLLLKDGDGRRLYRTEAELAAELRVKEIVEVPVMTDLTHTPVATEYALRAIIVNLKDYTIGADKGGSTSFFDDFDLDYNQFKYLLEGRASGALTVPKSAIVIEQETA